jgi:hypothetical protein
MKRLVFLVIIILPVQISAQVSEMKWELDYQIFLKMADDADYTYDISEVFHITDAKNTDFTSEYIFYPVNPGESYSSEAMSYNKQATYKTLWSALHANLGGGWVHFANCIAFALETQTLNLREPILKRPETDWKPDPVTESWKRTRYWEYYIPVTQKNATKEYKFRKKMNDLGDLKNLPQSYIDLFLSTSDREYASFQETERYNEMAKIDLIKVMLGANYLGKDQINYVSNAVLNAVKGYSVSKLPSVLIFDEFDAAAAMSLDTGGYKLESIVFRSSSGLSEEEMSDRKNEIKKIINSINTYNQAAFQKRLSSYYNN